MTEQVEKITKVMSVWTKIAVSLAVSAVILTVGAVIGAKAALGNDKHIVVVSTEDYATYQKFTAIVNEKQAQVSSDALSSLKAGNQSN